MSLLYVKLIPLAVSLILFILAFRVHERFWTLGFSGWKKLYLGLAGIVFGALAGVIFEFAEPKKWQDTLGWPVDWLMLTIFTAAGAALILWSSVERLALAAREREDLRTRQEALELFDAIHDAAQGPYSFLEVLNFSLKEILRCVDGDAGGIWLIHPSRGDYILACASGFALPMQQKLEVVNSSHPGFSRLAAGESPRGIAGADTLHKWFPELFTHGIGYDSLLGVPLSTKRAGVSRQEPLGLVLICSRGRALPGQVNLKLVGSAVTFLSSTVAEARAFRLVRSSQQLERRHRAADEDFSLWCQSWVDEPGPRRRLQTALAGLAEQAGDFAGCARYILPEDRWEPLALAGSGSERFLFGNDDFRQAAAGAANSGKEAVWVPVDPGARSGTATGCRMLPVADPTASGQYGAVLFLPAAKNLPLWWNHGVSVLVELARVVLALENPRLAEPRHVAASLPMWKPDWAELSRLAGEGKSVRAEKLAESVAKLLPPGLRAGVWYSSIDDRRTYRLLFAAARDITPAHYSPARQGLAPVADQTEVNAHLGGLVRFRCTSSHALLRVWPDFGEGWTAERVGFSLGSTTPGWMTFYFAAGHADPDSEMRSFLHCLAGMIDLLLSRTGQLDRASARPAPEGVEAQESGSREGFDPTSSPLPQAPLPMAGAGCLSLDRAVVKWIAGQPNHLRLGRMEFGTGPAAVPVVSLRTLDSLLAWAAGNLENGLPDTARLTVRVYSEAHRVRVTIERSDFAAVGRENDSGDAVPLMPLDQGIRDALMAWDGACRVVHSPLGPQRVIVSFSPAERIPATALVIDDQELIRDLLLGMLEVLEFQATPAATIDEAWERLAAQEFAAVICSSSMPGIGEEFLRRLTLYRPETRVFLVAEAGQARAIDGMHDLIHGILTKPFRIDDLRTILPIPARPGRA